MHGAREGDLEVRPSPPNMIQAARRMLRPLIHELRLGSGRKGHDSDTEPLPKTPAHTPPSTTRSDRILGGGRETPVSSTVKPNLGTSPIEAQVSCPQPPSSPSNRTTAAEVDIFLAAADALDATFPAESHCASP